MTDTNKKKRSPLFTSYQRFIIALLAVLQFTVILDFMVLSPLSAILLEELDISTGQFGWVVSAYAFSAGASGLLASGFADKFDRKRILLFFYSGFIVGTFFCGIAPNYHMLLAARIVTGLFGGVIGAVIYAIITDLFPLEKRGRVMGFVQMAFASSQVFGIPFGLFLATHWGWHSPFLLIVALGVVVGGLMVWKLKPIDEHLELQLAHNAFVKMWNTLKNVRYLKGFSVTVFLATGGFMLMPFGAAFSVNNLGISLEVLPIVYMITGICSMIAGPIAGSLSDKYGKYRIFWMGSLFSGILIVIFCHLGVTPLWLVIVLNAAIFLGVTSRMVASQALNTAVPEARDRGAYMGINASVMQISGGFASALAGMIIVQKESGFLDHYNILGYVVGSTIVITIVLMNRINRMVSRKDGGAGTPGLSAISGSSGSV